MSSFVQTASKRILVVDDNEAIHDDLRKILGARSSTHAALDDLEASLFSGGTAPVEQVVFAIDSALQGQEGLACVTRALEQGQPYALAFVDVRMPPGWDGVETIRQIWQRQPDLQAVICTAYSDFSWEEITRQLGHSDNLVILKKPFDNIEVLQLAHALTKKWFLAQREKFRLEELDRVVTERTQALREANTRLQQEMSDRQQLEAQLRQAQKMEAIGQLAAGVAHDFNNILTVIQGHVSLVLGSNTLDEDTTEALKEVAGASERAGRLTRQLLTFSRKQVMKRGSLDLRRLIVEIQDMLRRLLGEHICLECELDSQLPCVFADASGVEQVLLNLAVNARDAMPTGGSLTIRAAEAVIDEAHVLRNREAHAGRFVRLSVADTGCGMDENVRSHIFEPFFTTKEVGKGTGMGLSVVYGILKQHGGWVEVLSEANCGSTFSVFFPALGAVPEFKAEHRAPEPGGEKLPRTVLVVEDELGVRNLARTILQKQGYTVLVAADGVEAQEVWRDHRGCVDLLLTDMIMPEGVSGKELAAKLKAQNTSLKVIYSSGYNSELLEKDIVEGNGHRFLAKPYHPRELASAVRACFAT